MSEGGSLNNWYDKSLSGVALTALSSTKPTYSYDVGINGLPAVKFDGGSTTGFSFNCSFLNGRDYTIIINEQRGSSATQYFLQDANPSNLSLGYDSTNSLTHTQSGSTPYSALISAYSNPVQRQIIFVSSSAGKKIYINGLEAARSNDTNKISGLTTCYIGKSYNGMIGEIAIYNRALPI